MSSLLHRLLTAPAALAVKRPVKDALWTLRGMTMSAVEIPPDARDVLFVCHGNICRSPFAERLARRLFEDRGDFEFQSVGVHAWPGSEPPAHAVAAALPFGVDLRSHRSRAIDTPALLAADLVVGMEPWHGSVIGRRFPKLAKPCVLLSEFEETATRRGGYLRYNVPDPYGRDMRSFEECFARMESCLRGLRARLT